MSLDLSLHENELCAHCGTVVGTIEVFEMNVTHNLGAIASKVGIYPFLWRAPEFGIERAEQLIKPLEYSIDEMIRDPDRFLPLEPSNGWGTLKGFIVACQNLLQAAKTNPQARIETSR